MYADDTSLTFASVHLKRIDDSLNYDLNRLYTWLSANKLTLNLTKTEFILTASRQNFSKLSPFSEILSFIINDHPARQVSSTKSLKARLHKQFLLRQLDANFVALALQLQNRTCKPHAIFSAICPGDIAGISNMFETCCIF